MRRSGLLLGGAVWPFRLALAQDASPAVKVGELAYAGDFAGAAKIMARIVEQRPLDRSQRLMLGKLHFGAGDFGVAAEEFKRIEKRGGTKDDFKVLDIGEVMLIGASDKAALVAGSRFNDSATWLYLALLRQGAADAVPPEGPRESIRTLVRGDTTLDEYVDVQSQMMDALLGSIADKYGDQAEIADMAKVARRNLRAELTCVANFARAEQSLGGGDTKVAKSTFRDALDTGADRIAEFHIAKAELAKLT